MLDRESIETYKSIRLPRDLRADILAQHTDKSFFAPQKFLRPAAVLCSLVLILTVLITAVMQSGGGVYVDGERLGTAPRIAETHSVDFIGGAMRASIDPTLEPPLRTADTCIPLSLRYGKDVYLAVYNGSLLLPDTNGNTVFAGQAGEVKDGTNAYWVVDGCDTSSPLTAEVFALDGDRLVSLTLTYDATDGIWLVAINSSEK